LHGVFVRRSAPIAAALLLAGCTTIRLTEPPQTATEQLLVSTAVDHAVANLKPPIPPGSKVFVDAQYFDTDGVVLPKYTIGAVRDLVLHAGGDLVADRKEADLILEMRNGAQSIDHNSFLLGIPSIPIPIPLTGTVQTPGLAFFKHDKQRGVAKIALTLYNAKSGALAGATGPVFGDSYDTHWTVLLLITWDTQNILPDDIPDPTAATK
jgi:Family of unknown function (DUF6655)